MQSDSLKDVYRFQFQNLKANQIFLKMFIGLQVKENKRKLN